MMRTLVHGVLSFGARTITRILGTDSYQIEQSHGADSQPGNFRSTTQELSSEPRWITEAERESLWSKKHRLIAALQYAHSSLASAPLPGDKGRKFLTNYNLKPQMLVATYETLELLYSSGLLALLTKRFTPLRGDMLYHLDSGERDGLEASLALLENLPRQLRQVVIAFGVSEEDINAVCNDMQAVIACKPVPSLVTYDGSRPDQSRYSGHTEPNLNPPGSHLSDEVNPREGLPPATTEAMPGTFPHEAVSQPPLDEQDVVNKGITSNQGKDARTGPMPYSSQLDQVMAPPFSWRDKKIPIEVIQTHLLDPSFMKSCDSLGARAMPLEALASPGIIPPSRQMYSLSKAASPRRQHKIAYRTRKTDQQERVLRAPDYVPEESYNWRDVSNGSSLDDEDQPVINFEITQDDQLRNDVAITYYHSPTPSDKSGSRPQKPATRLPSNKKLHSRILQASRRLTIQQITALRRPISKPPGVTVTYLGAINTVGPHKKAALDRAKNSIINTLNPVGTPFQYDVDVDVATQTLKSANSTETLETIVDKLAISDEKEGDLGDHGAEQQLHADHSEHEQRQERQRIERERRSREEEQRLRETGGLRQPKEKLVSDLSGGWRQEIFATLSAGNTAIIQTKSGNTLRAHDFKKVIHPDAWLNDEIVNGSLEWLDDYVNSTGVAATRRCLSLTSFFWDKIKSGQDTSRALRRAGIPNVEGFLALETLLVPICAGNHWTLVVVRPQKRTIAHMDSMNPSGSAGVLRVVHEWVKRVCGDKFVDGQWTVANHRAPLQNNGNDCGAHVITNGICVALGLNAIDAYKSTDMPLQRLRIAGMLLNRGFKGDFQLAKL